MDNYVITIARGFGSGGKEIGNKLGKKLGIPCYERQILKMASEVSGLNENLFLQVDEKLRGNYIMKALKGIPFQTIAEPNSDEFVSDVNLFNIQAEIIRSLSRTKSCIIVGKCADYVLRHNNNVISIYIEAPRRACVKSIMNKLQVGKDEANKLIEKTDKYRAEYYKYYTEGEDWTNPTNYHMTLNSDKIGRDECVEIIANYAKSKFDL